MKLGVASFIFAAMAIATADIPKEEKNEVVLKEVRAENGERGTDVKLRQADNRQADLEAEIHAIVDAKLTAYQKKSETAAAIKSYLDSHSICQSGMTWNYPWKPAKTISFSPAFSKTPSLAVSLAGFRSKSMDHVKTSYIKAFTPYNVASKSKSSFTISWKGEQNNIWSVGITWIACL